MSISHQLVNYYSGYQLILIMFVMVCIAAVIGHLLDKALDKFAFGLVGNSSLILMSMIVAVLLGPTSTTMFTYGESIRSVVIAISLSLGLVLGLGVLKAFLPRWRLLLREIF